MRVPPGTGTQARNSSVTPSGHCSCLKLSPWNPSVPALPEGRARVSVHLPVPAHWHQEGRDPQGNAVGTQGALDKGDNPTDSRPVAAGSRESPSPASTGGVFPMGEVGRSSMHGPSHRGGSCCHWMSPQSSLHSPQGYPLVLGSPLELCLP